jgi:molybdate transport system substrate-binding protein
MKAKNQVIRIIALLLVGGAEATLGSYVGNSAAAENEVVVFAAASTTNAIIQIGELYETQGKRRVTPSFASSSTLAKQIASGAPADVYLSANQKWMNYLAEKGIVNKATRFDLLGNRIAFIVPKESTVKDVDVHDGLNLQTLLGEDGRLSIGDPSHVPAGMYGKKALENLGLWAQVQGRLAPMKDVRAALVLVERGEAPLGIVYATDAAISKKVRVVGTFPLESHPPIVYPVAAVAGGDADATAAFLRFLQSDEARDVFQRFGFDVRR